MAPNSNTSWGPFFLLPKYRVEMTFDATPANDGNCRVKVPSVTDTMIRSKTTEGDA